MNIKNQFSRTEYLLGKDAMLKLSSSHIAVFGLGGVGGYVLEALARSGVGKIDIIDNDEINITNLNRQLIALNSTIGQTKVFAWEQRLKDINPEIEVVSYEKFCTKDNISEFNFKQYDYIIDAIDTVSAKIAIIEKAKKENVPVISSMGTGNKIDPLQFEIADISKTSICPLARVIRTELKKRNIKNVKVLYSKEVPKESPLRDEATNKVIPASCAFVPSVAGLIIASELIKDLIRTS